MKGKQLDNEVITPDQDRNDFKAAYSSAKSDHSDEPNSVTNQLDWYDQTMVEEENQAKNVNKQTRKRTIDDTKGHSSDEDPKPKENRSSKDVIYCAKCRMHNALPPTLRNNA